jgi:hypothetical protein
MLGDWDILAADDTPTRTNSQTPKMICGRNVRKTPNRLVYMIVHIMIIYIYNYAYIHTLYHHIPHSNGNFKGYPPFSDKTMYGNIPEFLTYSLC